MRATAGRNTRRIGGWAKRRSSTSKGGSVPPVSMQIATSMVGTAQLRLCATLRNWIALRAREGNADAESAADRWPHRACHWPPLDRSGSGCNQLAAIELHDPADAVGRLRRGTGRARVDPDLAEAGAAVAVVGRNEAKSIAAVAELEQSGGKAMSVIADVTDKAAVAAMVERVKRELGRIDILVNNAGINIRKPPHALDIEEWESVMKTNLTSAFLCSQAAHPAMKAAGHGKIINIGSMMS